LAVGYQRSGVEAGDSLPNVYCAEAIMPHGIGTDMAGASPKRPRPSSSTYSQVEGRVVFPFSMLDLQKLSILGAKISDDTHPTAPTAHYNQREGAAALQPRELVRPSLCASPSQGYPFSAELLRKART